ncbi:MAG: 4-hydroxythreonine-4-phosphate dehydrogenase PdxA [Desulfarculaceae bacterium]|nr:4-hydroxythreonine-4-phosphate dehydrogenase PdxA [Desulfarculaceae bacterium]
MTSTQHLPIIGITMGDPAGIGPEIICSAMAREHVRRLCRPVVLGDAGVLMKASQLLKLPLDFQKIDSLDHAVFDRKTVNVIQGYPVDAEKMRPGLPAGETGKAMLSYIEKCVALAMEKELDAMVTAPVTKTALKLAGSEYHGHTELISHRTGADRFAMMLTGNRLKVVLVTIHMPLSRVPGSLTREKVLETIEICRNSLVERFGINQPKVAVAGLNPHAGEDGMFGEQERKIIEPAVRSAVTRGWDVSGPLPPDTVFFHAVNGKFDCVVCMYHDQGLIPFKMVHFKDGVNTTLGLDIIRTSVDHGTAYDIAWKGLADDTSLVEAVKLAAFQAQNQKKR